MRSGIENRIMSLFAAGNESRALNISEIAREIGAAYPHTHGAVKGLIKNNILSSAKIANTTFCWPNLSNELARNLMAREAILKAGQPLNKRQSRELSRLLIAHPEILSVYLVKNEGYNQIFILVPERRHSKSIILDSALMNIRFLTPEVLRRKLIKNPHLLSGSHIYGYEKLLLLIMPVHEQLVMSYSIRGDDE